MSLQPQAAYLVPEETARVAHAIFPTGNLVMRMDDDLGMLFHDLDLPNCFPRKANRLKLPRAWRSLRCCSLWRD
jgi:hypothetical protein